MNIVLNIMNCTGVDCNEKYFAPQTIQSLSSSTFSPYHLIIVHPEKKS